MAITSVGQYGLQAGTTTATVSPPAGTAAGDRAFLFLANKLSTNTPSAVTGFTQFGQAVVGTGSNGAGTGPVLLTCWYKDLTGAAGNSTITVTGGNALLAGGMVYRKGAGETWAATPTVLFGSDTTSGTGFSAAMPAQDGYGVGDWQLSFAVTTANTTLSARSTTLPGCTATLTGVNSGGTANGNALFVWTDHRGPVTAGTQSGVGTTTGTTAASTTGGALQIRVSLQTVTPISVSDSGSAANTVTVAAAVPVTDTGTGADAVTVAVPVTLTDTGSGTDALTVSTGSALAIDASSPAFAGASVDPWVTPSFTPPNNSLLVVVANGDWVGTQPTLTVTSAGLTFTSQIKQGASNSGVCQIWTAEVGSNGGTARTVSVATSLTTDEGGVKVYVFTGYDTATLVDFATGGSSTTNNLTAAVGTTTTDGCWVVGGGTEWNSLGVPTSTDVIEGTFDDADLSIISVRKSAPTSPAGAVTLNFDAATTSTAQWTWAAVAVRPAPGGGSTPISLSDTGAAADTATVTAAAPVTDTGTGSDTVTVSAPVAFADTGTGTDTLTAAATATAADTGTGTDSLAVTAVTVTIGDSGTGADTATATAALSVSDTGTGTDTVTVGRAVALADTGTGTETLTAGTTITLGDTGTATDGVTAAAAVPVTDTGTGTQAVTVTAATGLPDTGAGTDTLTATAALSVTDAGTAADTLVAGIAIPLGDTGTGGDTLTVTRTIGLADAGLAADTFAVGKQLTQTDAGTAAETLTVTVAATIGDTGHGVDLVGLAAQAALADLGAGTDTFQAFNLGETTPGQITAIQVSGPRILPIPVTEAGIDEGTGPASTMTPVATQGPSMRGT